MMDTAAPEGAFKMTNVDCLLLVLISKYGQMPVADEPETWIRELLLLVLVYEGITAGVFEMDYSPQCMTMSHPHAQNVSQHLAGGQIGDR